MSNNLALKYLRLADQVHNNPEPSNEPILIFDNPERNKIHELEIKLIKTKIYLESAIEELEWTQKLKAAIDERKKIENYFFAFITIVLACLAITLSLHLNHS